MTKFWGTENLGGLCDVLDSKRRPITKRDRVAGEYPYYGATGVLGHVDGYLFDEPLVLVGEDGAKWESGDNTAFAVAGKIWVNNHAHVLRPHRSRLIDSWLIYYLNHSDLTEYVSGLTVPKLNQANLREIPLPLPSLPEQQRIVDILDEAFASIAAAKANAEQNRRNARAVFEGHLRDLFACLVNDRPTVSLGSICEFVRGPFGGSLKKSEFVPDGYVVYEQQHAIYERFNDVRYFISESKFNEMKRFEVRPGDLIMSCSGTIGRVAVVPQDVKRGVINQALLKLKPKPEISGSFLKTWMESEAFQDALAAQSGGAAIQNVPSVSVLKEIKIPLPQMQEQMDFLGRVNALWAETDALESLYTRKLAALDELKQSLLHAAFSGAL